MFPLQNHATVNFDSAGRAYVRTASSADAKSERILSSDVQGWGDAFDFNGALSRDWPSWSGEYVIGSTSRRITFDGQDNVFLGIDGESQGAPFKQALVIGTSGSVKTFSLSQRIGINQIRLETADGTRTGFNSHDQMPTIIGTNVREQASYHPRAMRGGDGRRDERSIRRLFIVRVHHQDGNCSFTTHEAPSPRFPCGVYSELAPDRGPIERRTSHVVSVGAAGASSNLSVTDGSQAHIFWSVPGRLNTDEVHVCANTFNFESGDFVYDHSVYVATCNSNSDDRVRCRRTRGCNFDTHCYPTVTMDAAGYIHCIIAGHGTRLRHVRSRFPGSVDSWITMDGFNLDNSCQTQIASFPVNVGAGSYPAICSDESGCLHLAWRSRNDRAPYNTLLYTRKQPDADWEDFRRLIENPAGDEYFNYYHSLQYNRRTDQVYLAYKDPGGPRVLRSEDSGTTWNDVSDGQFP